MPNFSTPRFRAFIPSGIALSIAALIVAVLVLSSVPPVSRDALNHHLAVPKLYLQHGGLVELPHIVFSYYPMNVDLLYLVPLYLGLDTAAKYIHFAFALLTAWLIYGFILPKVGKAYALLGALCFLSIPVIVKLSITVYVDLGLILFTTAALLQILKWVDRNFQGPHLILSAAFCGLAAGTKYSGLIAVCLLTLFVPYIYLRAKKTAGAQRPAVCYGILYLGVVLIMFSPWMVRNTIWTGNPIYPLYQGLFRSAVPAPGTETKTPFSKAGTAADEKTDREKVSPRAPLRHFAYRQLAFGESGWEIALIPVRVFFQGRDDSPQYFDGKLNPYLFFFPLLAFVFIKRDAPNLRFEKKVLGSFAALFLIIVFLQEDMRVRWIGPIIPPLVILAVYGLKALLETCQNSLKGKWRSVGMAVCLAAFGGMLLLNVHYLTGLFRTVGPLEYLSGRVNRGEYIRRYRPAYKLHEYAAATLPEDATILGLFLGYRGYYSQRDIIFSEYLLKDLVRKYAAADEVAVNLGVKGITHLMLRGDLFEKWRVHNFNKRETVVLNTFFQNYLELLISYRGYYLYKLTRPGWSRSGIRTGQDSSLESRS